jgi:hypothetical protein
MSFLNIILIIVCELIILIHLGSTSFLYYIILFVLINSLISNIIITNFIDSLIDYSQYYLNLLELYLTIINYHPLPLPSGLFNFFLETSKTYNWTNNIPHQAIINPGIVFCGIDF